MLTAPVATRAAEHAQRPKATRTAATALGRLLLRRRLALLEERSATYHPAPSRGEIERRQVEAFNRTWARARGGSFYRSWQREHGLPDRIATLAELSHFPVLRKAHLQEASALIFQEAGPCRSVATGGSTGEPTRFPASSADLDAFFANAWTGRSWAGLSPFDRVAFIWGHAHLMGRPGVQRWARRRLRRLRDGLLNMVQLDAYRLTRERAPEYLAVLEGNPGAVVIAYASAFEKLLDALEDRGTLRPRWAPSHVILTSERVESGTLARVRDILGSVPLVEYGSGELGVVAYSTPASTDLSFLWGSFHARVGCQDELIVTTLDDRLFPLVHYGTGDRVAGADDSSSVLACREVLGRLNDAVRVPRRHGPPLEVHSELLTHVVRTVAGVRAFLVVEDARRGTLEIRLLTSPSELAWAGDRVLAALEAEVPDLDRKRIDVSPLEEEPLTLAGKRKFIERRAEDRP